MGVELMRIYKDKWQKMKKSVNKNQKIFEIRTRKSMK